jgi:SNF2 family DNA or RNA helicase
MMQSGKRIGWERPTRCLVLPEFQPPQAPILSITPGEFSVSIALCAPSVDEKETKKKSTAGRLSQPQKTLSAWQLKAPPVEVISVPITSSQITTLGCSFASQAIRPADGLSTGGKPPLGFKRANRRPAAAANKLARMLGSTRIRPPRDVVKLADRLRLLLEPPLESLLSAGSLNFVQPPFAYQLDGVAFLYPRREAVLADEMGLGKTMQAITAVRLLVHQGCLRRVLLVCPKPLVSNWQREFALWAPELCVTVLDGGAERRKWLRCRAATTVTITNYEALVRDRTDIEIEAEHFDLVILDEAQRIKNSAGATSAAVRSISRSRSWALTGTPMENSIDDLVGIFEFVGPGQIHANMRPRAICGAVADHVLRRTKDQVLSDLPPLLFRDAHVELTLPQAEAYRLAEKEGIVRLRAMQHAVTIQHVFELVVRLKQICNFDPLTRSSSKLERLEADLEECAVSGRKAIVFSQWVETLVELRERLRRFKPAEYHGQIPNRRREAEIARFREQAECHLLLMSYGAGSVGLNLQFADYVFLFDRWWNPAVEDQAINRAHRIGAVRPVTVTRFLTGGTIEERINAILLEKRELFDTVFGEPLVAQSRGLSRDEFFSLFNLTSTPGRASEAA